VSARSADILAAFSDVLSDLGEDVTLNAADGDQTVKALLNIKTTHDEPDHVTEGTVMVKESDLMPWTGPSLVHLTTSKTLTAEGVQYIIGYIAPPQHGIVEFEIVRRDSEYTVTTAFD
tara:strand:- start:228 stop:581 length:354 start_codon:yes stop_codon:yes gene_type:complete